MAENNDLEKTLWAAADKLRSNMDAAEYKHVVLGLIFLKYISDSFTSLHEKLVQDQSEGADPEDIDEYKAKNVFFVPEGARWNYLLTKARQPEIGKFIDDAMDTIERRNPSLQGVLPKIYADPDLNKQSLGDLMDLISNIAFAEDGHQSQDLLGRVYEYFLGQFADAEGKKGGQFYTPRHVVQLLVEMIEPFKGRVYDGCCGSGGMFVQSERFVREHQGNVRNISIFGQESNPTTLRLARMNLAIRGIDAKLEWGDTFLDDRHPDLKADYILANPPFNVSDWNGEILRQDPRWQYGAPPVGNANYAWLQHFAHKLSPSGTAAIVMANGSMNSNTSGEGEIRRNMIEAGIVDCMVALPTQLFYNTQIPVCLWIFARDRSNHNFRDRSGEILFIDARNLGTMINRRNKTLTDQDTAKIAGTYHAWRGEGGEYADQAGFCKAASLEEVRQSGYVLMPGRYVGTEEAEEDGIPFEEKMTALTEELAKQFRQGEELKQRIVANLKELGFDLDL